MLAPIAGMLLKNLAKRKWKESSGDFQQTGHPAGRRSDFLCVVRTHCLGWAKKNGTGDLLGQGLQRPWSDGEDCEADEGWAAESDPLDGCRESVPPSDAGGAGWADREAGAGSMCLSFLDGDKGWAATVGALC